MSPGPSTAVRTVLLDVAGPLAVYYTLHAAAVDDVLALALSAAPPLVHVAVTAVRDRRLPPVAAVALVALVAGLASALVTGSPRELLARDAWISAPLGLWALLTLVRGRPICFSVTQSVLPHRAGLMERLWDSDAAFRRVWRAITVVWGVVGLADSALRVLMAYTLPVPLVPALGTALGILTMIVLQVPTHVLLYRAGYWRALFAPRLTRTAGTAETAPRWRARRRARTAPGPSRGTRTSS